MCYKFIEIQKQLKYICRLLGTARLMLAKLTLMKKFSKPPEAIWPMIRYSCFHKVQKE